MRFRTIAAQTTLMAVLQLASPLAYVRTSASRQSKSHAPNQEETDHVRLSTPVVRDWREIHVGSPVYALDDAVATKDWLGRALIQRIDFQTGIWHIWIEPGYSVFRIYPYLSKSSPQPRVYQGIVLKVKGTLSVDDLVAAIRSRTPTVKIDEYDVFGAEPLPNRDSARFHSGNAGTVNALTVALNFR
jgi:hypothetical protein